MSGNVIAAVVFVILGVIAIVNLVDGISEWRFYRRLRRK
jgi:hypothetical protein